MEQQSVTNSATYDWTVNLYEHQGTLWASWSTNAPFRPAQSQIWIYANACPNPPISPKWWTWTTDQSGSVNTGLLWGSGWYGAIVAQVGAYGGAYQNVVTIGPTVGS